MNSYGLNGLNDYLQETATPLTDSYINLVYLRARHYAPEAKRILNAAIFIHAIVHLIIGLNYYQ